MADGVPELVKSIREMAAEMLKLADTMERYNRRRLRLRRRRRRNKDKKMLLMLTLMAVACIPPPPPPCFFSSDDDTDSDTADSSQVTGATDSSEGPARGRQTQSQG
jgi:hypothetical protein